LREEAMKISIKARLYLGFGLLALLVVFSGVMVWWQAVSSSQHLRSARDSINGAVALADAQGALWQLRYGFPQFMVGDEAARKKIVEEESKWKAQIDESLKAYGSTTLTAEEAKALKELQDVYGQYMGARPKWFELYGAGKLDEAKEWRAATTTPFGAGTVKGFTTLIDLQKKYAVEDYATAVRSLDTSRQIALGYVVVAVLLAAGIAIFVTRSILIPLKQIVKATDDLHSGNGDLTLRLPAFGAEFGKLSSSLNGFIDKLHSIIAQIRNSADDINVASKEILMGNSDLSGRTEQQASSLEESASSMEELTSTVKQNADNARQANQLAVSASEVAVKGGSVVSQVVDTMASIVEKDRRYHRCDRRYRVPDQYPGVERRGGGGARRRAGAGLRSGGGRGA
jgi:methyl-accepting chemotaxis protein